MISTLPDAILRASFTAASQVGTILETRDAPWRVIAHWPAREITCSLLLGAVFEIMEV